MKCRICEQETDKEICGWCENRVQEFIKSNENHSAINITWGCGRIAWNDAYALRDLVKQYDLKEVLEFGTGLSTEIWAILGVKVVTCDTLENHSHLFSKLDSIKGYADVIYYKSGTLPDFEKLYPGKKWELVFVDGGQGRDLETEVAMKLSSKLILLHDPGLSRFGLDLGSDWEQVGGTFLFKKEMNEEHKRKIGQALKGKEKSAIHKLHISENHHDVSGSNNPMFGQKRTKEVKEKIRKKLNGVYVGEKNPFYGKEHTKETKIKISLRCTGRKMSEETKEKLRKRRGELASNWQGGIAPECLKIRNSIEYSLWRESVFARDNWTCQKYGIKGGKLHSHHIKNFSNNKELRFAIDNGITFSIKAHREFHRRYGIKNNTLEQVLEFIGKNNEKSE